MTRQKFTLWKKDEYNYPKAGDFIPFIMATTHDDEEKHPALIVAPGGAYSILQPSEAEGPARGFFELGYNTFVLVYTNNVTMDAPVGYQPIRDISRAVRFIRSRSEEFGIDTGRVYAAGYSAGGPLVAHLAVRHSSEILADSVYPNISNRLNATFVHYPLVSEKSLVKSPMGAPLGGKAFSLMFGDNYSEEVDNFMSLDRNIPTDASPMFIFHGTNDTAVSWEGAVSLAAAAIGAGVPCELHLFHGADHGVTNEANNPEDEVGSLYVCDQLYEAVKAMSDEELTQHVTLLGDLSKDMSYNEFMQTVHKKTLLKIWTKALGFDIELVLKAMQQAAKNPQVQPMPPRKNENALLWKDMAVNWLKML